MSYTGIVLFLGRLGSFFGISKSSQLKSGLNIVNHNIVSLALIYAIMRAIITL